ncbi:NAD(P)-dependent oxidoreductase [Streptomyces sp. PT12]|uniref:NAD(P)-dependent oxidoreductase n=1 Tax=Streptomyces sp. PT12 TaxID=1510197 RepID=UPI0015EE7A1B|nr:NAD(P)-binding domain-containing protein [Streptomyces sp. PT12]
MNDTPHSPSARPPSAEVAVLGTGRMGGAIVRALLSAGHTTAAWNRSPGRVDPLVSAGAIRAETAATAAAAAPLVILCVTDDAAARGVIAEAGGAVAGRTLVNVTSHSPDEARRAAAYAGERGADYLAAPAMADHRMIGSPETQFLYAGPRAAYERHEPTLLALGKASRYVGADPGVAPLFEAAMNSLYFEFWVGYLHALALVRAEGVPASDFAPVVSRTMGQIPPLMPLIAQQADTGDYDPAAYGSVTELAAMTRPLIALRRSRGIDTSRLDHLMSLLERRAADGQGAQGPTSLLETIESRRTAP